jgi:hypothetical protein
MAATSTNIFKAMVTRTVPAMRTITDTITHMGTITLMRTITGTRIPPLWSS